MNAVSDRNVKPVVSTKGKLPPWLAAVVIFAATLALYLPALSNGFVWDDEALVLRDPLIRSWRLGSEAFDHFLFVDANGSDFYRPLQRLTYIADYQFYAFAPWGYHLTSAILHALAAVALFLLARTIIARFSPENAGNIWPALATALIWGVHPLHTSAVTYVAGRADPLAALFCFLGLAFAVLALRNPLVNWREFVAGLCFLLSAFSKEIGLVTFGLWLITVCFAQPTRARIVAVVLISASALGVYAFMRSKAERADIPATRVATLAERPVLAAAALADYAELVAYPSTLRMERGAERQSLSDSALTSTVFKSPPARRIIAGVALAVGFLLWLGLAMRRNRRAQALALTLAAVSYLPVSNILSLNATVAEHWLYLPLAFALLAASLDVATLLRNWRVTRPAVAVAIVTLLVAWVVALAMRTYARQSDWRDAETFLTRTMEDGGASARMYINRAQTAARRNDHVRARVDFSMAERLSPDQPLAQLGLAALDLTEQNFPAARDRLVKIKDPFYRPPALELLALLARAEKSGDGMMELNRAISLRPDDWPLLRRKVKLLIADGKNGEATTTLRDFVFDHPFRAEAWLLLSDCMRTEGNLKATAIARQRALERDVHLQLPPEPSHP